MNDRLIDQQVDAFGYTFIAYHSSSDFDVRFGSTTEVQRLNRATAAFGGKADVKSLQFGADVRQKSANSGP